MTTTPAIHALAPAGRRLTQPRRQVAALIDAREGRFTAADLAADVRAGDLGVGRATIFRTLDLFAELGLVERLELPSGDHAYVRCDPAHHHHVMCEVCGRTEEVDDCGITAVAKEIARRTGYRIEAHRLELFGVCPDCAAGAKRGEG